MKILITGAAGFIGSHTAERFKKEGHEVVGLDNFNDYYDLSLKKLNAEDLIKVGVEVVEVDLRVEESYKPLPTDFDFIIHFAAQPGISSSCTFEEYLTNNIIATEKLIKFAHQNKNLKHFINIGTSSIYGLEATFPESVAPMPASNYGVTKLAAEQLVLAESRSKRMSACSLRLYSVYGPRERPEKLYTKLIACAFNKEAFPLFNGSEKHLRSFTYVGDIVDGIVAVVNRYESVNGEIINLGTEVEHTTQDGIDYVEELLGQKVEMNVIEKRPGDQWRTNANIDKAKELLDYNPTTGLKEGLQYQIDWYKEKFL
ncbi:NAD-dependent epimerase/dehydratase family protein [Mesonia sp.]|uniref:NAD-dependent epimerase/dehydratase family protein n=1 Tax=Mesonia sp. TaxID=1960830 RepID=UPI00176EE6B3|nr:NAD-dependent epimerase/dehydratase family protein [Mesonia sp.]HIB37738.1 NAD-dependent epimerase/dehydratase family protein [Mesonia sp.]HIO26042.1 NAD-dependent epimerase/dehydratase family protein [Flavobacteriaceae bacterium]